MSRSFAAGAAANVPVSESRLCRRHGLVHGLAHERDGVAEQRAGGGRRDFTCRGHRHRGVVVGVGHNHVGVRERSGAVGDRGEGAVVGTARIGLVHDEIDGLAGREATTGERHGVARLVVGLVGRDKDPAREGAVASETAPSVLSAWTE